MNSCMERLRYVFERMCTHPAIMLSGMSRGIALTRASLCMVASARIDTS